MKSILTLAVVVLAGCSSVVQPSTQDAGYTLGGAEKQKSCKSPRRPGACEACLASKCRGEYADAFGSDPNAFGGRCGDYAQCTCDCLISDEACYAACGPKKTAACRDALAKASSCSGTNCAECRTTLDLGDAG